MSGSATDPEIEACEGGNLELTAFRVIEVAVEIDSDSPDLVGDIAIDATCQAAKAVAEWLGGNGRVLEAANTDGEHRWIDPCHAGDNTRVERES